MKEKNRSNIKRPGFLTVVKISLVLFFLLLPVGSNLNFWVIFTHMTLIADTTFNFTAAG